MSRLPLRVRDCTIKDLELLYSIDRVCFAEAVAFSKEDFRQYLNRPDCVGFVAEGHESILGFILAHIEAASWAHIVTLDVLPEFRRQHIGTVLMNTLHNAVAQKGIGAVVLEVSCGNYAAQKLYGKLHYKILKKLPDYYPGREDAYLMLRTTD